MGVSTAHKHVHEQTVPATEWVITHSLKTLAPMVDVLIDTGSGLQKILPLDITAIDNATVKVTFSSPRTGKASVI